VIHEEATVAGIIKRGKIWHMRMRVPCRYAEVESRPELHRSLKTDSEREALARLPAVEKVILAELDALLVGCPAGDPRAYFKAIADFSMARGNVYKTADVLAAGPLDDLVGRVLRLAKEDPDAEQEMLADADLGGVELPPVMLSGLTEYVEEISEHENRFKNEEQLRIWRTPRNRAISNLLEAIGKDRPVAELTREDAISHRKLWERRVKEKRISVQTANKDFTYMSSMLKRFFTSVDVEDPPKPYAGVSLTDKFEKKNRKKELPVSWIKEKILAPGALDGLNEQARDILLISIETGCRQSEISNLPSDHIFLDVDHPHFVLENVEGVREVKNMASHRAVPLVGIALEAMRRHPEGFPRYRGSSNYSATVNKFLRERGLFPGVDYTIGGTRHTFETRMKDAKIANDDRAEMMGHSVESARNRELYGDTMPLWKRTEIAELIAFKPPFGT